MAPIAGNEPGRPPGDADPPTIPFARQEAGWWCGAAALGMVYASFGLRIAQAELWGDLARGDHGDHSGVGTHRLGHDAESRGFAAEVLRAARPWEVLRACHARGVRVILNVPLHRWSRRRHFATLAGVDDERVTIHDPLRDGPEQHAKSDFLDLWGWTGDAWDSASHYLVAIARTPAPPSSPCAACGLANPASVPCRRCRRPIRLEIPAAHGCLNPGCSRRSWWSIVCPRCDNILSIFEGGRFGGAFPLEDDVTNPDDIRKLSQAFEAYFEKLNAAGRGTSDPRLVGQFEILQAELKSTLDRFSESMHDMNDRFAADRDRARERVEKANEKAEKLAKAQAEALERIAAKKAEKLARAQAREKAKEVDPHLGAKLRELLLDEFGTRRDVAPKPAGEYGSAIDYWPGS